jgi:hypothetical protein
MIMANIENSASLKQTVNAEEIRDFLSSVAASLEEIAGSLQTIAEAMGETDSGRGFIRTLDIGRDG